MGDIDVLQDKTSAYLNSESDKFTKKKTLYVYSDDYIKICDNIPKVSSRASVVHSLIGAYGLLDSFSVIVNPRPATKEQLCLFHSGDYVESVQNLSGAEDDEKEEAIAEQFGLTYDCPAWPGVYEYASFVAGASMLAAQCLVRGVADMAINWPGGWHHAKRDEASGFCYFNDAVLAILTLRKKYDRVLYVDIDLHHGDGVEDAFCGTPKVFTLSLHKQEPGFFPGSGSIKDIGIGKGRYYSLNVPLKDGIQDDQYIQVFKSVAEAVRAGFEPHAVVCQCGGDGLFGDPMMSYNLTSKALVQCVQLLKDWDLPLLLLGGGGYNTPNTARCWTEITAMVLGKTLSNDIPEHKNFPMYGPDYELAIEPGNRKNKNEDSYIDNLIGNVSDNIKKIKQTEPV